MSKPTQEQIDAVFAELDIAFPLRNEITIAKALVEARVTLAAATKRAEAAEAKLRDVAYWHEAWKEAEAERDALRKDAARLDYLDTVRDPYSRRPMREVIGTEWSIVFTHPATHTPTIREALDAALAVQP